MLILITASWTFSLLLAFLPFSTNLQHVFTDQAIIRDNLFFENVTVRFNSAKNWAEKLLTFSPDFRSASAETAQKIRDSRSWPELHASLGNASEASILDTESFIG